MFPQLQHRSGHHHPHACAAPASRLRRAIGRGAALLRCLLLLPCLAVPQLAQALPGAAETAAPRQGEPARVRGAVSIRVAATGWGAADARDIARVLGYVAEVLAPAFPRHAGASIDIAYSPDGPVTLLERAPGGAYRVYLKVQDTRWDQFTYQFAHEYCHIVTNAEQRADQDAAVRGTQWFEEALCEAVSLLALQRVGARWEQAPPVATVPGYGAAFGEYAAQLHGQPHRHLPAGTPAGKPLEAWFAANRAALQRDPYIRPSNEVVAGMLYTWLVGQDDALEAIGYLGVAGLRDNGDGQLFANYLERWQAATPPRLRGTVARVPALFGIASPVVPRLVGR